MCVYVNKIGKQELFRPKLPKYVRFIVWFRISLIHNYMWEIDTDTGRRPNAKFEGEPFKA